MKRTPLLLSLATALAAPAFAADSYTVDVRHTFPVFEVSHLGFSTQRGRFNKTEGKISLDLAARSGAVDLTIDAASIDMGIEKWDEHMKSDEFFNVAKFPTITFKSDKLVFNGDKVVAAEGTLTLLGVAKPVKLAVANFVCADHPIIKKPLCAADISTTIKRSEFGMTKLVPAVGDEVKLVVPIEAYKD